MVIKMTWLPCALFRSIDFARLVQIFYPFSLQTHPHSFPGDFIFRTIRSLKSCNFQLNFLGESPKDCPRDAKPDRYINCCCIQLEIQSKFCSFFANIFLKVILARDSGPKCLAAQTLIGRIFTGITGRPNSPRLPWWWWWWWWWFWWCWGGYSQPWHG